MRLHRFVQKVKNTVYSVPERLALSILIWLEKEPSQEGVVLSPSPWDVRGPYLRYTARSRARRNLERREPNRKETVA